MKTSTRNLVLCSLFAAMTAVFAQISIPLPFSPVPINFAIFMVLMSGALLGSKLGAISIIVFALMGAVGLPVFANFSGGLGTLVGPTGGYIIGYIFTAYIVGLITEKFSDKLYIKLIAMTVGVIVCYVIGTVWFVYITKNTLAASLGMCVIPFIPGDVFKIIAGSILATKLSPALQKSFA